MVQPTTQTPLQEEVWHGLVAAGIRAPSGDNCQPWLFRREQPDRLSISMVPERAKSFFDFRHRATFLSIGAVIENIRTEAAYRRKGLEVHYLGGETRDQPAASIRLTEEPRREFDDARRRAMLERTVNRRPFFRVTPAQTKCEALTADPVAGTRVQVFRQRRAVRSWARLIYLADRIRYSHPLIHRQLFDKILLTREQVERERMGLEFDRLGIGPGASSILKLLKPWERMQKLSRVGVDTVLCNQSRLLALSSGAIVLVTIPGNTAQDWMHAGEQVERLWVGAQQLGLSVHPMAVAPYLLQRYEAEGLSEFEPEHEPILREMQESIKEFLAGEVGAMVFRLGYALRMSHPAVRLPLEQFVETDSDDT